ncbi:MAG: hypothetical protein QMD88_08660 [Coprothermobacterota bacterium]|nr:hypothetical protein [Coprothermobacterota bacterium]
MNLTRRVLVVLLILAFPMVSLPLNGLAQTVKVVPKEEQAAPQPLIWHVDYPFQWVMPFPLYPGETRSPQPQKFSTSSIHSFTMSFSWNPADRGPIFVRLVYEGTLGEVYANTFSGGYGSFTVNYFPYEGIIHIFVSNLDPWYAVDIIGTVSLWYE